MQKLTLMTMGAAFIGVCGLVYDTASAQTPAACSDREVSIYFDRDTTEFNKFSQQLVERVATEAKTCGAKEVVAELKSGPERAQAVTGAFKDLGVKVTFLHPPAANTASDSVADRAVIVRVASVQRARRLG